MDRRLSARRGPHGYVIFDGSIKGLVSEYSFTENATAPISNAAVASDNNTEVPTVVKVGSLSYATVDLSSGSYTTGNGKSGSLADDALSNLAEQIYGRSKNPIAWNDVFFDSKMSNYAVSNTGFINSAPIFITQSETLSKSGGYACAVNALCCASIYLGISNFDTVYSDFNSIWSYTSTSTNGYENGKPLGSTKTANIGPGFSSFASSKGTSIRYSESFGNVSFSFFKSCINSGGIAVLGATIYTGGENSGHAMSVQGYQELTIKDKAARSSTFEPDVVIVSDGWNNYPRFINLEAIDWISSSGGAFYR